MGFQGVELSVSELLAQSNDPGEPDWSSLYGNVGLRNDAADAAAHCAQLLVAGESLNACWRFGILQAVDYYESSLRRGGVDLGSQVFDRPPPRTRSREIDAAFAALAEHLAARDGWTVPAWATDPDRVTPRWYAAQSAAFHDEANRESPPAFRSRGVYISANALNRA